MRLKFTAAISIALLCGSLYAADPSGLNELGHLRSVLPGTAGESFAFARLEHGVQFRVNGVTKNVIFYGPDTVRVNANAGRSHWTQPSIVVDARPAAVPFEVKDAGGTLAITSATPRARSRPFTTCT